MTFYCDDYEVIPFSETIDMVEAINNINGNIKFTMYSNTKHDSWTETYNNKNIYSWLLSHIRKTED